ncbi:MAG TPA: hypothetical protein VFO76_01015 [Candidatus Kapabacteria bacterium]|nr:hypothetical protein [Candidatus Kapabacteria bacterium]
MNLGRTILSVSIFMVLLAVSVQAQSNSRAIPFNDREFGTYQSKTNQARHVPPAPIINLPGTTSLGLEGMYQQQFGNRSLHNIVADPDNPKVLHAAITFAKDVTEADTAAGNGFLPQLQVYYLYSADGGTTWSTPKAIDTARTSIPVLILIKRGTEYVPVISAVRNVADTNTPNFCSLYLEQGAPGDGNFKEFRTDRKTFYDSLRNINFPNIALSHDGSKIFMVAGVDNYNPTTPQYIQFSTFTLSEDKKSATWGGWKQGPNAGTVKSENPVGFAFPWSIEVQVSPAGKVGVTWLNRDYAAPDLSTYLSESLDDGATWPATPKTVLAPVETQQPPDPKGKSYYFTAFNTDFWYNGEQAEALLGGFYYNLDSSAGYYVPASGTIFYWNAAQSTPIDLISKEDDTEFGSSMINGDWLAGWQNVSGGTDIQGLWNVLNPTVARGSNPKAFAVYFNAWQDGDIQEMADQIEDGTFTSYPYFGIWRVTTLDGGVTFSGPDPVRANDLFDDAAPKFDYRGLETMMMNPDYGLGASLHIMFNVDTNAGIIDYKGNPGLDEVTWLFQKADWADVKESSHSNGSAINYPNPFAEKTSIPLALSEASRVTLEISNQLGQRQIYNDFGILTDNTREITVSVNGLSTGSYPYVLTIGSKKNIGVLNIIK